MHIFSSSSGMCVSSSCVPAWQARRSATAAWSMEWRTSWRSPKWTLWCAGKPLLWLLCIWWCFCFSLPCPVRLQRQAIVPTHQARWCLWQPLASVGLQRQVGKSMSSHSMHGMSVLQTACPAESPNLCEFWRQWLADSVGLYIGPWHWTNCAFEASGSKKDTRRCQSECRSELQHVCCDCPGPYWSEGLSRSVMCMNRMDSVVRRITKAVSRRRWALCSMQAVLAPLH